MRRILPALLVLAAGMSAAADEAIRARDLQRHVAALAAEKWEGRAPLTPGGEAAAEYIARAFTRFGLEPCGDGGPYQDVLDGDGRKIGRNVCFALPGGDEARAGEAVLIGAHYDHLGTGEQGTFRGADDNASGVAGMLEIAEWFAARDRRPARTLIFVAFDNEEEGLRGSEQWAGNPTVPQRVVAMICLDMLGRSMMDRFPGSVFAFGTEWSRDLGGLLRATPRTGGVEVWDIGWEYVGPRSDFVHFGLRGIPFVFFTTGTHRDYHTPRDVPERVDYRSAESVTRLIADFAGRIADAPRRPRFHLPKPNGVREAEVCRKIVGSMLADPPPEAQPWQTGIMRWVKGRADRMVERRRAGLFDRAVMILSTQILTLTTVESERTSPERENGEEEDGR